MHNDVTQMRYEQTLLQTTNSVFLVYTSTLKTEFLKIFTAVFSDLKQFVCGQKAKTHRKKIPMYMDS